MLDTLRKGCPNDLGGPPGALPEGTSQTDLETLLGPGGETLPDSRAKLSGALPAPIGRRVVPPRVDKLHKHGPLEGLPVAPPALPGTRRPQPGGGSEVVNRPPPLWGRGRVTTSTRTPRGGGPGSEGVNQVVNFFSRLGGGAVHDFEVVNFFFTTSKS